jgi:dCMP deaminase
VFVSDAFKIRQASPRCNQPAWREGVDSADLFPYDVIILSLPAAIAMSDTRVGWNEYFMGIAEQVATRSTCDRKNIGAVIVRDKTILSTGYNGSLRGAPHCDEAGHDMENGHCVRTVHAEANAVAQAAKNGVALDGGEIYVTASPCLACFKLIANCGIRTVFYKEFYRDQRITSYAAQSGITLVFMGQ